MRWLVLLLTYSFFLGECVLVLFVFYTVWTLLFKQSGIASHTSNLFSRNPFQDSISAQTGFCWPTKSWDIKYIYIYICGRETLQLNLSLFFYHALQGSMEINLEKKRRKWGPQRKSTMMRPFSELDHLIRVQDSSCYFISSHEHTALSQHVWCDLLSEIRWGKICYLGPRFRSLLFTEECLLGIL